MCKYIYQLTTACSDTVSGSTFAFKVVEPFIPINRGSHGYTSINPYMCVSLLFGLVNHNYCYAQILHCISDLLRWSIFIYTNFCARIVGYSLCSITFLKMYQLYCNAESSLTTTCFAIAWEASLARTIVGTLIVLTISVFSTVGTSVSALIYI